jgi:hypothetical protein
VEGMFNNMQMCFEIDKPGKVEIACFDIFKWRQIISQEHHAISVNCISLF